jgi:CMP-N,N'-diacetyllegionaminic acid synthase
MAPETRPVLALIPARAGSKGIPQKNLALLCGRPLLAYTLEAALHASLVDEVWLSSDDSEMLALGRRMGARALIRPSEFAGDNASAVDVVLHFLECLPGGVLARDPYIVYLQPTSPLRQARHIDQALTVMQKHEANTLVSVVGCEKSPFKSFVLDDAGRLQSLFDQRMSNARRQDLPKSYFPNGAIYIFNVEAFRRLNGFPSNGSLPFEMTAEESVDIDIPEDILRAEKLLGAKNG